MSPGELLAPGKRPKATDIVLLAMQELEDRGTPMGFKAVDRMMRKMWASEARAKARRELTPEQVEALKCDNPYGDRMYNDPVGDLVAYIVDCDCDKANPCKVCEKRPTSNVWVKK